MDTLADVVSGITKGRKIRETELIEVPYMAVSNVKDGYIDWTTVKTIMATKQEIEQYRLLPHDVLMTEGGDPDKLGRGSVITKPLKNSIHQNHIFRVRLQTERILPVYFSEYLQHQKAKRFNDFDALWNGKIFLLMPTEYQSTHVFGVENAVFECYEIRLIINL